MRLSKLVMGNDLSIVQERVKRIGNGATARREMSEALAQLPAQREFPGRPALGVEMAKCLIGHGADVNYHTEYGSTPLSHAVVRPYPELVGFLLSRGADPNFRPRKSYSKHGAAPLWLAVTFNNDYAFGMVHAYPFYSRLSSPIPSLSQRVRDVNLTRRVIALLLDAGGDPMSPGFDGYPKNSMFAKIPFQRLCYWGEAGLVRHMLRKGAKPNAKGPDLQPKDGGYDCRGYTALHCAALRDSAKNAEVAKILLAAGADPTIKDQLGRTPLDVARQKGNRTVAAALGG